MDLFEQAEGRLRNYLPYEGEVYYFDKIMDDSLSLNYFEKLYEQIAWQHDQAIIHHKHMLTKRKVAWYGDQAFSYSYSNTTKKALPWTDTLLELKQIIEIQTDNLFNSCLLNLYHSGEEAMSWHSDAERELVKGGAIASLSLGAERKFCFKHRRSREKVELYLQSGSLLLMQGLTQQYWLHSLPVMKKVRLPRINLTFRQMLNQNLEN